MQKSDFVIYFTSQEAWDAMYQAILDAEKSIYWELYIFIDDEVGRPFFDVLAQKAESGVDVKLVIDAMGSFWLSNKRVDMLKKSGVDVRFFYERKRKLRGWWQKIWSRTHRKILVVDEKIGFIGGVNIQKHMKDWLDIQVKLQGKVIHSLLRVFAKSYIICGGEKKSVRHLLKYKFRVMHDKSEIIFDEPNEFRKSHTRHAYEMAFLKARERIILFSPYYFPDKKFLRALWQVKKRGVRVDLLVPFRVDIRFMQIIANAWFSLLKNKYCVNVYLSKNMMHGKGVIIDDDWAMVGSSNLDQGSFYDNYEANLKIQDRKNVGVLKTKILFWLENSVDLDDEMINKKTFEQKIKEKIAMKLYKIWYGDK